MKIDKWLLTIAVLTAISVFYVFKQINLPRQYVKTVHKIVLLCPYEAPYIPIIKMTLKDGEVTMERTIIKAPFKAGYRLSSGVIVSKEGVILTAAHCVKGTSLMRVQTVDGHVYRAAVIAQDVDLDLALVKIIPSAQIPFSPVKLGIERPIGWPVFAIGNPLGLPWLMTSGIISGYLNIELLSDTVINPGSSGGGLFDATTSRLQGVTVGTRSAVHEPGFSGHSVTVRITKVKEFLQRSLPLCG